MRKRYWCVTITVFAFLAMIIGAVFLWFWMYADEVFSGKDGNSSASIGESLAITIGENGNWFIAGVDTGVLARANDGLTPYINENGNWCIGTSDTGVRAEGVNGTDGKDGADGKDGLNGKNGANGKDGTDGSAGKDGKSITDTEINSAGELILTLSDGSTLNVGRVVGRDGADGANGKDGLNGKDGSNGIDGAEGKDGVDGKDGLVPYVGANGNWWIGDKDTLVKAEGKDGTDGTDGNGIIEMKITDGSLFVRYTKAPSSWVNIGAFDSSYEYSLKFYPLADGTLAVGAGDLLYCDRVTVPRERDGKTVSAIVPYGFAGALNLTYIGLPDTVSEIGESAFSGASSLSEIIILKSVSAVGSNAFSGCTELTVKLEADAIPTGWSTDFNPDGCEIILGVDGGSGITADGLRYEESNSGELKITAYEGSAQRLVIPDTIDGKVVSAIAENAFRDCVQLLSLTLPEGLTEIEPGAFSGCVKLIEIYNLSDSITLNLGSESHGGAAERALSVHTLESDTSILVTSGDFIFTSISGSDYLVAYTGSSENLILPEYYNSKSYKVYDYALFGLPFVKSLTVSKGVREIGKRAFALCPNIEKIVFDAEECAALQSDSGAFAGSCKSAELTVGSNAKSIPGYLFASVDADIASADFGNATQNFIIDSFAFYNLTSFKKLVLSPGVSYIGTSAFVGSGLIAVAEASGTGSWRDSKSVYDSASEDFLAALKSAGKSFTRKSY